MPGREPRKKKLCCIRCAGCRTRTASRTTGRRAHHTHHGRSAKTPTGKRCRREGSEDDIPTSHFAPREREKPSSRSGWAASGDLQTEEQDLDALTIRRWLPPRSEERRVGKECRSRWWPDQ